MRRAALTADWVGHALVAVLPLVTIVVLSWHAATRLNGDQMWAISHVRVLVVGTVITWVGLAVQGAMEATDNPGVGLFMLAGVAFCVVLGLPLFT